MIQKLELILGLLFTGAGGGISIANLCQAIQPIIGTIGGIIMIIGGVLLSLNHIQRRKNMKIDAKLKELQYQNLLKGEQK